MRFFILLYFVFLSPLISQNLKLCEVNKAKNPLITVDQEYLLKTLYGPFVVDHGKSDKQLVPTNIHPFIYAAHKAFAEHRPLVISPDGIWTLITQGTQIYLSQNSKEYREYSKSLLKAIGHNTIWKNLPKLIENLDVEKIRKKAGLDKKEK